MLLAMSKQFLAAGRGLSDAVGQRLGIVGRYQHTARPDRFGEAARFCGYNRTSRGDAFQRDNTERFVARWDQLDAGFLCKWDKGFMIHPAVEGDSRFYAQLLHQ